jgi:hypothetical protein
MKIIAIIIGTSFLLISAVTLANKSTSAINGTIDFSVKITENISSASPIGNQKKLYKMINEFTLLIYKISDDKIITDEEVIKYKEFEKRIGDFEEAVIAKYANNEKANAKIEKWEAEHDEEVELVFSDFTAAIMSLFYCEGADKLGY